MLILWVCLLACFCPLPRNEVPAELNSTHRLFISQYECNAQNTSTHHDMSDATDLICPEYFRMLVISSQCRSPRVQSQVFEPSLLRTISWSQPIPPQHATLTRVIGNPPLLIPRLQIPRRIYPKVLCVVRRDGRACQERHSTVLFHWPAPCRFYVRAKCRHHFGSDRNAVQSLRLVTSSLTMDIYHEDMMHSN
jgi:hypothetical protein